MKKICFFPDKPYKVDIKITNSPNGGVTKITCRSNGYPAPNFIITQNNSTNAVSTKNILTIAHVEWSYTGKYTCIAWNKFGNASASKHLGVTAEGKVIFKNEISLVVLLPGEKTCIEKTRVKRYLYSTCILYLMYQ